MASCGAKKNLVEEAKEEPAAKPDMAKVLAAGKGQKLKEVKPAAKAQDHTMKKAKLATELAANAAKAKGGLKKATTTDKSGVDTKAMGEQIKEERRLSKDGATAPAATEEAKAPES